MRVRARPGLAGYPGDMRFRFPLLALGLLACSELLSVDIEDRASTVVEGAGALGGVLGVLQLAGWDGLSVTVEDELANQGVAKGDLVSAQLTALVLSSPDGELDFLTRIDVYVESPGVEKVRLAYADEVPDGATTLALTLEDVDLVPYIEAESLAITTSAEGVAPVEDTTVDANLALTVTATPRGACNAAGQAAR